MPYLGAQRFVRKLMTKRQLIDEILDKNHSARPSFLAQFGDDDLQEYLDHLSEVQQPRFRGDPHRYDAYFQAAPATRPTTTEAERQWPPARRETIGSAQLSDDDSAAAFQAALAGTDTPSRPPENAQDTSPEHLVLAPASPQPSPPRQAQNTQSEEDTESWLF